jgi:hypothetical protein
MSAKKLISALAWRTGSEIAIDRKVSLKDPINANNLTIIEAH